MRDWARTDPLARDTVRSADEVRAIFLADTLHQTGIREDDARDRANLIVAAWRGSQRALDPDYRMKLIEVATSEYQPDRLEIHQQG